MAAYSSHDRRYPIHFVQRSHHILLWVCIAVLSTPHDIFVIKSDRGLHCIVFHLPPPPYTCHRSDIIVLSEPWTGRMLPGVVDVTDPIPVLFAAPNVYSLCLKAMDILSCLSCQEDSHHFVHLGLRLCERMSAVI